MVEIYNVNVVFQILLCLFLLMAFGWLDSPAKWIHTANQQTMNFKFPHDILCSRTAHDNRRSRRSRWIHLQSTSCFIMESSVCHRPGGEAFSVYSVYSVV